MATVDRLLNGREGVSAGIAARVLAAAQQIGHPALARLGVRAEANLPNVRFGVLLHKSGQEFYRNFAEALTHAVAQAAGIRGGLVLDHAASQSPSEVAGRMRALAGKCDVLAATAVSHPEITAAVTELQAEGVAVFALLSDFAQGVRAGYIGLNNLKMGRVAGWTIALAAPKPGPVAVFVGGARWHGHDLRETGFRAYLREAAPHLRVLETLVNLETRQLTYEATLALLTRQPDLRGIYVAGGGMEGAIAALREVRHPGDVALVVNELTAESRAGLLEGWVTLVSGTPLPALTRDLIAMMAQAAQDGPVKPGAQHFLTPELFVSESI